jgi:hypothetical protein
MFTNRGIFCRCIVAGSYNRLTLSHRLNGKIHLFSFIPKIAEALKVLNPVQQSTKKGAFKPL